MAPPPVGHPDPVTLVLSRQARAGHEQAFPGAAGRRDGDLRATRGPETRYVSELEGWLASPGPQ